MIHTENIWLVEELAFIQFVIISGPAGGGKSYLVKRINEIRNDLYLLVKYTTRDLRESEQNNIDYYFVTKSEFFNKIREGTALASAFRYNTHYGLSIDEVEKALHINKRPLLILDVHLAIKFKEFYKNSTTIFVSAENVDEVYKRLNMRNDLKDNIISRKQLVEEEVSLSSEFDFVLSEKSDLYSFLEKI